MKEAWVLFAAQQVQTNADAEVRVFGTLTFGGQRMPGPQRGRKAVEIWFEQEDILSGIATEERGSENDRLHYHFVVVIEMYAQEDSIGRLQDRWTNGYSLMDIMRDRGALEYVVKYATKSVSEAQYLFVKERTDVRPAQMPLSIETMFASEQRGGDSYS